MDATIYIFMSIIGLMSTMVAGLVAWTWNDLKKRVEKINGKVESNETALYEFQLQVARNYLTKDSFNSICAERRNKKYAEERG